MTHQDHLWSNSFYPTIAYLIAFVGSLLGLACASRLQAVGLKHGKGWLASGALSLGTGIWGMHFVAMLGYSVTNVTLHYDIPLTALSWVIAVVVVGLGMVVAGHDASWSSLLLGGLLAGLGVAGMHYLGMRAILMPGTIRYDPSIVALSVVIAIVAATAALWATLRVSGRLFMTGAALVMGVAVTGMHYTGMLAVTFTAAGQSGSTGGVTASAFVVPLVGGLTLIIFLVTFSVLMNPVGDLVRELERSTAANVRADAFAQQSADAEERVGTRRHGALGG